METDDKLIKATKRPDVGFLVSEFTRCNPFVEGWNRCFDADAVRFCRWINASPDGKKHDTPEKEAFPWDGASDTRPMVADEIINDAVSLMTTSFWRAIVRAKAGSDEVSSYAVTLADHYIHKVLREQLTDEVELAAQYINHYGWCAINVCWQQKIALENRDVTLADLQILGMQLAKEYPDQPALLKLNEVILDPSREDEALETLRFIYDHYTRGQLQAGELEAEVPEMKDATIRKCLHDLRLDGTCEVPVPYLCENQPAFYSLKPWDEIYVPEDTTEIQRARIIFQREWIGEAELRARIPEEGYDAGWVDAACKQKGRVTSFTLGMMGPSTFRGPFNGWGVAPLDQIEVLHAFYRSVDNSNVPAIYCTTFHSMVTTDVQGNALYAKHELINYPHGEYPFVGAKREHWCRALCSSRGIPRVVQTWQNEIKSQRDGIVDWTSIGVLPPVNVYKTPFATDYKFGPAIQNTVQPGKEPHFMQVPTAGVEPSLAALERMDLTIANYFGRLHPGVPPEKTQTVQAHQVDKFLIVWSKAMVQMIALAQRYISDSDFSKITGAPQGWLEMRRGRLGTPKVELTFDTRELNEELTLKRIEAVNTAVLPTDVQGVVSRGKWIEIQLRAINPVWAQELVTPAAEASDQLFKSVQNDIALMFLGNAPKMVENDPTAPAKLQFAQQIVQANPTYQQALTQPGRFAELMQMYMKNLTFSVSQQQNKTIGRIGVNPQPTSPAGAGGGY